MDQTSKDNLLQFPNKPNSPSRSLSSFSPNTLKPFLRITVGLSGPIRKSESTVTLYHLTAESDGTLVAEETTPEYEICLRIKPKLPRPL